METFITLDLVTWVSLVICFVLCGSVFGIYYELMNYRRNIKDTIDYIETTRKDISNSFERNETKLQEIEGKIEYLEMYITSRKS